MTALLEYIDSFAQFLLAVFDAVELAVILQGNVGIFKQLFQKLWPVNLAY